MYIFKEMIPSVRLGSHEFDNLMNLRYREAKIKRLNQVTCLFHLVWDIVLNSFS